MLFIKTIKDDVELYSYHVHDGSFKGQTYYVVKSNKIISFAHYPDTQIRDIVVKDNDNVFKGEFRYLKTIPINQLKMMLHIKPDLTIEDTINGVTSNS